MNKLMQGSNSAGQSIVDRVMAAKHTVAGQNLQKVIGKATTEEVLGPKRKHLDYLLQCTNEPNVSIPQMANLLIERTQSTSWVIVFKSLVTAHNLLNYGNERFTQYLASNNCSFSLSNFMDKAQNGGYEMSTFIRRYSKYLNEKAISYRLMAFDFCKVKRGKEDGMLRTMNADKLLKTLPVLQAQLDALVEFDVTPNELCNGVINSAFMLMFKDLIRLFACYNDGIINLLEKFFEMNKKTCREALDVYKKFLGRMDRVCEFLKVAENVGIDKGDIPDLAKAPSSLLDALEQHLASLESSKKSGNMPTPSKPAAAVSDVISSYAAASQVGTAPGAGSGVTQITEEERRHILEEEQRQLDQMKQRLRQATSTTAGSPLSSASSSSNTSSAAVASIIRPSSATPLSSSTVISSPSKSVDSSPRTSTLLPPPSLPSDDLLGFNAAPLSHMTLSTNHVVASGGTTNAFYPNNNPFSSSGGAGSQVAWGGSPVFGGVNAQQQQQSQTVGYSFASEANFATVFGAGSTNSPQHYSGFDGHGELMRPMHPAGGVSSVSAQGDTFQIGQEKLLKQDLDASLASLAGNLSIRPTGQVKKTDHHWTSPVSEKRLTGAGTSWAQSGQQTAIWGPAQPSAGAAWGQTGGLAMNTTSWNNPGGLQQASSYTALPMVHSSPSMMSGGQGGMPRQPNVMSSFPLAMDQPRYSNPAVPPMSWGVSASHQQSSMFNQQQQQQQAAPLQPLSMQQPLRTANDPFGFL